MHNAQNCTITVWAHAGVDGFGNNTVLHLMTFIRISMLCIWPHKLHCVALKWKNSGGIAGRENSLSAGKGSLPLRMP